MSGELGKKRVAAWRAEAERIRREREARHLRNQEIAAMNAEAEAAEGPARRAVTAAIEKYYADLPYVPHKPYKYPLDAQMPVQPATGPGDGGGGGGGGLPPASLAWALLSPLPSPNTILVTGSPTVSQYAVAVEVGWECAPLDCAQPASLAAVLAGRLTVDLGDGSPPLDLCVADDGVFDCANGKASGRFHLPVHLYSVGAFNLSFHLAGPLAAAASLVVPFSVEQPAPAVVYGYRWNGIACQYIEGGEYATLDACKAAHPIKNWWRFDGFECIQETGYERPAGTYDTEALCWAAHPPPPPPPPPTPPAAPPKLEFKWTGSAPPNGDTVYGQVALRLDMNIYTADCGPDSLALAFDTAWVVVENIPLLKPPELIFEGTLRGHGFIYGYETACINGFWPFHMPVDYRTYPLGPNYVWARFYRDSSKTELVAAFNWYFLWAPQQF